MKHKIISKGFSLVELIIVVAIFLVITMVVVFNQNRFSSDISISNIAYQIALQIREAQVYGTLVRQERDNSVPDDFNVGYGVNFFKNGNAIDFSIFADTDARNVETNGVYGDGRYIEGEDTIISTFNLSEDRNLISSICLYSGTESECMNTDSSFDQVNIVFRRPEPNAFITGGADEDTGWTRAEINLTSALRDKRKVITVRNTGQISVTNPPENAVQ